MQKMFHSNQNPTKPVSSSSALASSNNSQIATASHETLLRLGNTAYMLLSQLTQAKAEAEAQKAICVVFKGPVHVTVTEPDRDRKMTGHTVTAASTSVPPPSIPNSGPRTSIVIPPNYEEVCKDDFPNSTYWDADEWVVFTNTQARKGVKVKRLDFLTDEDGTPVSQMRIDLMTDAAKTAWNQLHFHRLDPTTWGKRTDDAMGYFSAVMRKKFPEFRFCNNNWKRDSFATVRYPDWTRHCRGSGGLTCANPSKGKRKQDDPDDDIEISAPAPVVHKKRRTAPRKQLLPPPPEANIIDIDEAGSSAVEAHEGTPNPTHTLSSIPAPITKTAPDTSDSTTSGDSPRTVAPSNSNPLAKRASNTAGMESSPRITSENGKSTAADTNTLASVGTPKDTTPEPSLSPVANSDTTACDSDQADTATSTTITTTPDQSAPSAISSSSDTEASATTVLEANGRRTRRHLDPLANISIPKPATEAPVFTGGTPVPRPKAVKKGGGKKMEASVTLLTARNLFAIDYLQDHSVTVAEFAAIYKSLDKATTNKYEVLSKRKKFEAHLAASTSASTPTSEGSHNTHQQSYKCLERLETGNPDIPDTKNWPLETGGPGSDFRRKFLELSGIRRSQTRIQKIFRKQIYYCTDL
ncbi:hypothetical protein BD779DRAFT_1479589 [Infundibulicybe gibba]|nr:hypothetical protein BD779DRAFT_1479589 [Infundibulicybe gibba]